MITSYANESENQMDLDVDMDMDMDTDGAEVRELERKSGE